jgi:hypothetical protein
MSTFFRPSSNRANAVMSQWKRDSAAARRDDAPEQSPEDRAAHLEALKARIRAADAKAGRKPWKGAR